MIGADAVRALALGALAAAIALDEAHLWAIALVAFVEGGGAAVFSAAQSGALRAVVPPRQLPAAAAVQPGRQAAVTLAGPPLGGALFGLARALPFLVDAVSYAFSTLSLLAMRTPFEEHRERDASSVRARLAEGFRFLWGHPFLRTCAFLYGLTNFIGPGLLLAVVVVGERPGALGRPDRPPPLGVRRLPAGGGGPFAARPPAARRPRGPACSSSGRGSGAPRSSSSRASTSSPRACSPPRWRSRPPTRSSSATGSP